jgi:hypothetical protein
MGVVLVTIAWDEHSEVVDDARHRILS